MKSIKEFFTGKKEEPVTQKDIQDNPTNLAAREMQIKDVMARKKKMLKEIDEESYELSYSL